MSTTFQTPGVSRMKGRKARRKGSIIVITALAAVVLLGFCAYSADLGRAAATRNKMQRACDAAALAGAQLLPENPKGAETVAIQVAALNGAPGVRPSQITIYNNRTTIRVSANQNVGFGFASIFNIRSATAVGAAIARIDVASQVDEGIVPIAITPQTYEAHKAGDVFFIDRQRQNQGDLDLNEFILLNLAPNGKSMKAMQDQVAQGWDGAIRITDPTAYDDTVYDAVNGAADKLNQALNNDRFVRAQGAPWYDTGNLYPNIPAGSPRIVTLILTPPMSQTVGTYNAPVVGFVNVYLQAYDPVADRLTLRVLPASFDSDSDSDGTGNPSSTGIRTIRLIG